MPRRTGISTNPYLLPVYNATRHPCYKPPQNHVAARALMQVVGAAEIKSEEFLKILAHRELRSDLIETTPSTSDEEEHDVADDSPNNEDEFEDDEEQDEEEDDEEEIERENESQNNNAASPTPTKDNDNDNANANSSISRLRITRAKQFADHHRIFCSECRHEHFSILDNERKKIFRLECASREKIITEEWELRRNGLKQKYMERHIQILRYLEATKRQRLRAQRQAHREENQRRFDAEEAAARAELVDRIFSVDLNKNLIEAGVMHILNYIMMEERIERKDQLRIQRAEKHLVTIASHLRTEKIRRIESAQFTLVKSEPTSRRLVDAEYERAVQKLLNWDIEGRDIVANIEHANRLKAEAAVRFSIEKKESEARSSETQALEILARDELNKAKAADRYRIYTEQLKVKRQELELNEEVARRQMELMIARQRVQLFLRMLPSVEAGKRLEVRVEAWNELKELACEGQMNVPS